MMALDYREAAVGRARARATRLSLALSLSLGLHYMIASGVALRLGDAALPSYPPLVATLAPVIPALDRTPASAHALPESNTQAPRRTADQHTAANDGAVRATPTRRIAEREAGEPPKPAMSLAEAPGAVERYYSAEELDVYPRLHQPLRIEWNGAATGEGAAARVLARVSLNEAGMVEDVSIEDGDGKPAAAKSVRAALRAAVFLPAQKDGRPVKSRIVMSIEWEHDAIAQSH